MLGKVDVTKPFPFRILRTLRPDGLPKVDMNPQEVDTDLWKRNCGSRKGSAAEGPR